MRASQRSASERPRRARVSRAGNASGRVPFGVARPRSTSPPPRRRTPRRTRRARASRDRRRSSTSIGGVSLARRMPNERMVRSWTSPVVGIDGEPLGEHPAERHVRGADRVRAQHDLVERIAGRDAHLHALDARPSSSHCDARAGERAARRRRRTCRARPPAARVVGGSARSDRRRRRASAPSTQHGALGEPDRTHARRRRRARERPRSTTRRPP